MTHIHGDILRIYEIEVDAYTEPLAGAPSITPYSFAFNVAALSTVYFTLTSTNFSSAPFLMHSINISTNDVIPNRIYLIHYPAGIVLLDAYFRYDSQKQFSGGDVRIDLTDGSYIRVYVQNRAAGIRFFEGTIWYTAPVL